jgi:hypothetical protein
MEFPLTTQDRDYFYENSPSTNEYQTETVSENKRNLMNLITELESDMRKLEDKVEKIKTIIYHL